MKKVEFRFDDLGAKAHNVYVDSSFVIYKENGEYYIANNSKDKPYKIGSITDLIEYLESFAEEEE